MWWKRVGLVATLVFLVAAVITVGTDDPLLAVLVYLAAAASAASVARGMPVQRWVSVVLVVLPAELSLVSLLDPGSPVYGGEPRRPVALDVVGMLGVAAWAATLAVLRPHHDETTPEL